MANKHEVGGYGRAMAETRTELSAARVREGGIELLEEAAEQSRPHIVAERVRANARWFLQAALATTLASAAAIALSATHARSSLP